MCHADYQSIESYVVTFNYIIYFPKYNRLFRKIIQPLSLRKCHAAATNLRFAPRKTNDLVYVVDNGFGDFRYT